MTHMEFINTGGHGCASVHRLLYNLAACLVLIVTIHGSIAANSNCALKGNEDLPGYDPVIITSGRLAVPKVTSNGKLEIDLGSRFTLACPGKNNKFQRLPGNIDHAEVNCRKNGSVEFNSRNYQLQQFNCAKAASGKAIITDVSCARTQGVYIELGFEINGEWYENIKVCHNLEESASLYSEHILYGSGIQENVKTAPSPGFDEGGLYPDISVNNAYKRKNVQDMLEKTLGSKEEAQQYLSKTFLARGHLSPRADFLMQVYQNLTFSYVNTVPEWQSINVGNWVKLENMVRKHAEQNQVDLNIISGAADVLTLLNAEGHQKSIYLYNESNLKKLPVPKFIWKVVYGSKHGIAFVAVNNPFLKKITAEYKICQDVCQESGWYADSWQDISKGYLYCCSVKELQKAVDSVPKIKISSLLNFQN